MCQQNNTQPTRARSLKESCQLRSPSSQDAACLVVAASVSASAAPAWSMSGTMCSCDGRADAQSRSRCLPVSERGDLEYPAAAHAVNLVSCRLTHALSPAGSPACSMRSRSAQPRSLACSMRSRLRPPDPAHKLGIPPMRSESRSRTRDPTHALGIPLM